jgi:hypothetical protein
MGVSTKPGVDADALRAELMGHRPGEPEEAGFGGAVGRYRAVADNGLYGTDPDDGSVVGHTQVRQQGLDDEGMGPEVDIDDGVPQWCGQRADRIHTDPAGGVDKSVDPLHRLGGGFDSGRDRGIVGDVNDERRHAERLPHLEYGGRAVPE